MKNKELNMIYIFIFYSIIASIFWIYYYKEYNEIYKYLQHIKYKELKEESKKELKELKHVQNMVKELVGMGYSVEKSKELLRQSKKLH